jgi:hypothetical protein
MLLSLNPNKACLSGTYLNNQQDIKKAVLQNNQASRKQYSPIYKLLY